MSERITSIDSRVRTATLFRAVVRLESEKHPGKLAVIARELERRKALGKAA
jgi:hypothetical protein